MGTPRGAAIGSPVVTLLGIGVPGPGGVKISRLMTIMLKENVFVCLFCFLDWRPRRPVVNSVNSFVFFADWRSRRPLRPPMHCTIYLLLEIFPRT